MRWPASCLAFVVACGPTVREAPVTSGDERPASACPPASAVRHAHFRHDGGTPHWGIALGRVARDREGAADDAEPPPAAIVAREEVVALGLAPGPAVVWVLRQGAPACRATISHFHATWVEDGRSNLRYEAVSTDCVGTEDDGDDAWVSDVLPGSDCELRLPTLLGTAELAMDAEGAIGLPTASPRVPAPYAEHLPPPEIGYADVTPEVLAEIAASPPLWRVRAVPGAPGLAEVWVTHVLPDPPDAPCNWLCADYVGLHRSSGEPVAWPPESEEPGAWPRARTLAGVLVDRTATRVVLLTDHAWSGTYDLSSTGLMLGRALEEFVPHEEDGIFRSLGPYCGP